MNWTRKRTGNKKIIGATKLVAGGVKFDSKLEKHMYDLLRGAGIEFEFQKVYTLQNKFRYGTKAIRAITLTTDFLLPKYNMVIDTKGYANDTSPLKYKMLKHLFFQKYIEGSIVRLPSIEQPSDKKECDLLLNRLLYDANR